ncbi:hypothetical protein F4780DRAFT_182848 [Xylariomycetidae sp. FL0641]|nr:hypothetical protein F4780DRAFT_182848 [Xylariomycetidae sp. FL0641]
MPEMMGHQCDTVEHSRPSSCLGQSAKEGALLPRELAYLCTETARASGRRWGIGGGFLPKCRFSSDTMQLHRLVRPQTTGLSFLQHSSSGHWIRIAGSWNMVLKQLQELGDRALVTTCSHIFCPDCAARLGLTSQRHESRHSCPACGSHLTSPDDAVIANLNPTEDYKTSVLSGLSPNVIMECASRALSFWAYQTTQEVIYQEYMAKTLTDKYSSLSVHLDKVLNDANAEITDLHNKLTSVKTDQDHLRKKNEELVQAYKEKNRKLLQTQELYDKLKRKAMMGQIQDAAEDAVDSTIHGASFSVPGMDDGPRRTGIPQEHEGSYGQRHPAMYEQQHEGGSFQPPLPLHTQIGSWPRTVGAQSDVPLTPSTHRQRIGEPSGIGLSAVPGLVTGTPRSPRYPMHARASLGDVSSNMLRNNTRFPSVGLSSGLKVGQGGQTDEFGGSSRPRAVQRPTPLPSTFNRRPTGQQQETVLGGIRSGLGR